MGDGTRENPYTREDVEAKIKEHGGPQGIDLTGKVFEEGIDLRGLDLRGIILNKARFPLNLRRDAPLSGAKLKGVHLEGAHLRSTYMDNADLSDAYLEVANLGGTHLEKASLMGTHLGHAYLGGAHLQGAILQSAEFYLYTGLESVDWGNYILGDESLGFDVASDTYRRLKMWYTEHGIYDIAGEFFFREMTVRRKALKWLPNPFPKVWSKLISLICGYGERLFRVITSAAVVVLGLALIYFAIGTLTPNTFLNSLYYSAVSFTALGYGQWAPQPTGWVKGLGAFEAFLGVFIMALFLITFVRKMTR